MRQLTRFAASAAATVMAATAIAALAGDSGTATADGTDTAAGNSMVVPLVPVPRRCDFTQIMNVATDTWGTASATITRSGSMVTAEVRMSSVRADIWYGVRLVQVPRPGIRCGADDPGVGLARLYTDGAGIGTVTVQAPVMPNATGAWVSVEGPLGESTTVLSGDVRTTEFVVPI